MKFQLTEFRLKKLAGPGSVQIEFSDDDGDVAVSIPPPACWTDEATVLMKAGKDVELCKHLFGDDETYARFVDAGGSAALVGEMVKEANQGATAGK